MNFLVNKKGLIIIKNISDRIFIMNDQSIDHLLIKNSNEYKQSLLSPLTEIADSGIVSRITPLSSINGNKLFINPIDDDDDDSIATENQCLSVDLIDINKRMIFFLQYRLLYVAISSGT
jgi:hypothetical protein